MLHPFWARYAAFEPLETNRIKKILTRKLKIIASTVKPMIAPI